MDILPLAAEPTMDRIRRVKSATTLEGRKPPPPPPQPVQRQVGGYPSPDPHPNLNNPTLS